MTRAEAPPCGDRSKSRRPRGFLADREMANLVPLSYVADLTGLFSKHRARGL
jgi:hypothetical protein